MKKAFALSILAVIVVGCGAGKPGIVGDWDVSGLDAPGMPSGSKATMAFQDKDFNLTFKMSQNGPTGKPINLTMIYGGTYEVKGEDLTMKFTSFDAKSDDAAVQKMLEGSLAAGKQTMLDNMNKTNSGKLAWDGEDKVTMKSKNNQDLVLVRVKK
ncbi:MAG: hypothetical protein JNJ45_12475 [Chthonomonas sp.]|nr:hypothetical protein [Chthonomonas sp.]